MAQQAGGEGRWVANAGRNLSGKAWEGGQAALVVAISAFACEARERRGGSKLSADSEESGLPAFFGTGLRGFWFR